MKHCVNERQWIDSQLERSSPKIKPTCSHLDYYSVSENDCRASEALAKNFYVDLSVQERLQNCATYFKTMPNVAFDMVY